MNRPSEMNSEVLIDLGSPDMKLEGQSKIVKGERQSLKDISMNVELRLPKDRSYKIQTEKVGGEKLEVSLIAQESKILAWEHSKVGSGEWQARLTVPSRVIEGHHKMSGSEFSTSLYTNKGRSDEKYHLGAKFQHSTSILSGMSLSAGAQIMYPGMKKPVQIKSDVSLQRSSGKGSLELDIFRESSDKVVVNLEALRLNPTTVNVQALVKSPVSLIMHVLLIQEKSYFFSNRFLLSNTKLMDNSDSLLTLNLPKL